MKENQHEGIHSEHVQITDIVVYFTKLFSAVKP